MHSAEGPPRTSTDRGIFVIYLRGEGHFWYFTFIFSIKPDPPLWSTHWSPILRLRRRVSASSLHRLFRQHSGNRRRRFSDSAPATDNDDETGDQD